MTNTQPKEKLTDREERSERDKAIGRDSATGRGTKAAPGFDALELAQMALEAALEKKGLEPVLLDVRALCSYTEYILLLSGRSDRQVNAIVDGIRDALRLRGRRPMSREGVGHWSLLDYGDLIVHVFHHPRREHYDLESLWIEAPRHPIDVPAEARIAVDDLY